MATAQPSTFVRYPKTVDLKALKGEFLQHRLRLYRARPQPTCVTFTGTVKIDGTNTTMVFNNGNMIPQIQSRNQIITPQKDNYGAAAFLTERLDIITSRLGPLIAGGRQVMVAGELAGKDVTRKGPAIASLDKFFVVFAIIIDGKFCDRRIWNHITFTNSIYSVYEFPTFEIRIDFRHDRSTGGGERATELAKVVDAECPVARQLGGIRRGLGEGIVWQEDVDRFGFPTELMRFKSVGPTLNVNAPPAVRRQRQEIRAVPLEEGESSQPATQVDPSEAPGVLPSVVQQDGNIATFINSTLTVPRLQQAIRYVMEENWAGGSSTAAFLKNAQHRARIVEFTVRDILTEEGYRLARLNVEYTDMEEALLARVKQFLRDKYCGKTDNEIS